MEVDSSRSDQQVRRVLQAEDEANRKVQESRTRVKQANIEADQEINQVKDEYIKRVDNERAKGEAALGYEKRKLGEGVRQAHRDAAREHQTLKSTHEKDIHDLTIQSEAQRTAIERESEKKLTETRREATGTIERERRLRDEQIHAIDSKFQAESTIKKSDHEAKLNEFNQYAKATREKAESTTRQSIANSQEHYEDLYQSTQKTQAESLDRLNRATQSQLEQARISSSHRLNAFNQRNEDPFYRAITLGLQVQDTPDAFIVRAPIPEHEKDRIQLNVRGNELIVSGKRKNEEKLTTESGNTVTTSSYQAYSEAVPLDWPIDPRGITRSFEGGVLSIRLPKKLTYDNTPSTTKPDRSASATRAAAIRPQFPGNLPGETELQEKLAAHANPSSPRRDS